MEAAVTNILVSLGLPGAIILSLGLAVKYLHAELIKSQNARIEDAKTAAAHLALSTAALERTNRILESKVS